MKHDLIQNLIKHTAVKGVLALGSGDKQQSSSQESSNSKNSTPDMFKLPSMPRQNESLSEEQLDDYEDYDSDTSVELSPRKQSKWKGNIHNVDVTSADFKALPADVRFDVLTDLKETRKQNSWGRLHEMPEVSQEFSSFQMQRLLKRRRVQESLESAEKEMGGKTLTLEELERMLTEQGIETNNDKTFRIAADSTTRLIYINDPGKLKKSSENEENVAGSSSQVSESDSKFSLDSEKNINTSEDMRESLIADINEYDLESDWESDEESWISEQPVKPSPNLAKKYFGKQRINPALAYMLEHAGLPQEEIFALIDDQKPKSSIKVKTEHEKTLKTEAAALKIPEKEFKKEKIESEPSKSDIDKSITESPGISKIESVDLTSDVPNVENSSPEVAGTSKVITSDSDTDSDLVEIPDVPIPEKTNSLEILVKSDEIINDDDDLFADVFVKASQNVSDPSSQDVNKIHEKILNLDDSNALEKIPAPEAKVVASQIDPNQSEVIEANLVETPIEKPVVDTPLIEKNVIDNPTVEPTDFQSTPSTSRTEESTDEVSRFKPQLLQANHDKLVSMQVFPNYKNCQQNSTGKLR